MKTILLFAAISLTVSASPNLGTRDSAMITAAPTTVPESSGIMLAGIGLALVGLGISRKKD